MLCAYLFACSVHKSSVLQSEIHMEHKKPSSCLYGGTRTKEDVCRAGRTIQLLHAPTPGRGLEPGVSAN